MKILRFAFILVLGTVFTPAFMLAQRGGGHGGGGGGHSVGGGGGVRMGGGISGGGISRPGGFATGGSAFRGSPGVAAGGAFRGGVNGGFNRGFGGLNRGFTGFRFGFGYPFYGYPFYGYPFYGYGYGYPGYYSDGYYPNDSGYGYGYSDPYAYNSSGAYGDSGYGGAGYGDSGYGYPSQAPAFGQNPGSANYATPMPPTPGTSTESFYRRADYYLIAFNDHTIQAALTYHVEGDQIYWTTREHEERHAPISSVDRRFTEQMNRDRRVEIRLP